MNDTTVYRISVSVADESTEFEALFLQLPSLGELIGAIRRQIGVNELELSALSPPTVEGDNDDDFRREELADINRAYTKMPDVLAYAKGDLTAPVEGEQTELTVQVAGVYIGGVSVDAEHTFGRLT